MLLVVGDNKLNVSVAAESHPTLLVKCFVCEPAPLKVKPFQIYGKALGQILRLILEVLTALTAKINVAAESHPTALVKCAV